MITGLSGIGRILLAALTHGHHDAEQGLTAALAMLTRMISSPQTPTRPSWWHPSQYHPATGNGPDSGRAGTGMAHGVAGPTALLSLAHTAGYSVSGQESAIRDAATWLLRWQDGRTWPPHVTGIELDTGIAAPAAGRRMGGATEHPASAAPSPSPGMRLAPAASARRYLYELLTGCALATAPGPYHLSAGSASSYGDFVLGIPASLAAALAGHARRLLDGWGIGHEPLQWQPPDDWVTAVAWPGADPARTDPAAVHQALLNDDASPFQIASDLGISLGHLRQVLRRHPLPRPRRPVRRTLIPAPEPAARPPGQQPGVIYLDPAWLREEYLTWHRSLDDIAAQVGCTIQTLNRFARDHGVPVRTRGTSTYTPTSSAPGLHPRDLPQPLRSALIGPRARGALTGCCSSPGIPASPPPPRHSASGTPPSTTRSSCSNEPAAGRSSTAGPAPQAPRY